MRALLVDSGSPETHGGRVVVFFAGFMVSPWSYRSLFASIVSDQTSIVAPQMYRRGPGPLIGRPSAMEEAEHGVQVAGRVAEQVVPVGVIAIDPVDGAGRRPTALAGSAHPKWSTFDTSQLRRHPGRRTP
ncbi:MAG TPA: hypothetical protein VMY16_15720 [Ilumatobacteraceae bacterium]|nr:hypothetical protein [Ilumatobacteraceae bacterium]